MNHHRIRLCHTLRQSVQHLHRLRQLQGPQIRPLFWLKNQLKIQPYSWDMQVVPILSGIGIYRESGRKKCFKLDRPIRTTGLIRGTVRSDSRSSILDLAFRGQFPFSFIIIFCDFFIKYFFWNFLSEIGVLTTYCEITWWYIWLVNVLFSSLQMQFKGTLTYSRLYSKKYASENGQFHFLLIGFDVGVIRISELGSHISE